MKKSKSIFKRCEQIAKAFKALSKDMQKACKKFRVNIAKVFAVTIFVFTFCACNSVRATVKGGATTTITVTTNNPSNTQVTPNTDLKIK